MTRSDPGSRRFPVRPGSLLAALVALSAAPAPGLDAPEAASVSLQGELRRWHRVTLTLPGPRASETGTPNPFLDYRLEVTFAHAASTARHVVPGYFAADGRAAETSAREGDRWRAHFAPEETGLWSYSVSFRRGPGVALREEPRAGTAVPPLDGAEGSFTVEETDKTGRDLRGKAKGLLRYVGTHHLRFASGEYFLKAGADAPENFLAYDGFDDTPNAGHRRKSWAPHVRDWRPGDPTWKGGEGKGIIGALNYLSSKGMNAFSFLTYSYDGDDENVFPHVDPDTRLRMDCSKLDQWEIVFAHADRLGLYLHFKTQETENDQDMDGGALGRQRKLYYRELVARFSHHLALNWNLGEENTNSTEQLREFIRFFARHDPYHHLVVVHTFPPRKEQVYGPLLGRDSGLTGVSLQCGVESVFRDTRRWREASAKAGWPWVVANDEQGPAGVGVKPDADDPRHDVIRKKVLWGNLMAGGAGVEYYFGYRFAHSDLTCEDWRTRDAMWDQSRHALEFFRSNRIPFQDMRNRQDLVREGKAWCLAGARHYVLYLPAGGDVALDLAGERGSFRVGWFDPLRGGALLDGAVRVVEAGGARALGEPPRRPGDDWAVLVRPLLP